MIRRIIPVSYTHLDVYKRQSWTNARLDALLMQINPHFLYNTLDIIRWEAMYLSLIHI